MATPDLSRRSLITGFGAASLGLAAGGLAGTMPQVRRGGLLRISSFNDRVQAALFDPERMAQEYPPDRITTPFPFNAFYPQSLAPDVDAVQWRLQIEGRVERTLSLDLAGLRSVAAVSQTTRLICIEGWSAVGAWTGPRLSDLLALAQADLTSRYVGFYCADGYWTSIDMASALHPQTILALDFLGQPLPRAFGKPARLRLPIKLGFKNAKHVERIVVTNDWIGGYWEDGGYNWFAGL
jgi:DMSO/TMAO reductase YedYZ molybdopterin-dependent catalytic subunit